MMIPGTIGKPALAIAIVPRIPPRPATEPTDRSIPAVRITSVCPTAMIATTDTCTPMLNRLFEVRKYGEAKHSATNTTISPPAAVSCETTSWSRSRIDSGSRNVTGARGAPA